MFKKIIGISIIMAFISINIEAFGCSTTISGPSRLCPGSEQEYTAETTYNGSEWTWSCSNCEVFDPITSQWTTSYTYYSTDPTWYQVTRGRTDVKFSTTASTATVFYSNSDDFGTGTDSHTVTLGAPTTSAGSLSNPGWLQNCNNSQVTVNLSPTNNWVYNSWGTQSGLSIVNSTSSSATVKATSTTATGNKTVTANMKWKDSSGSTCGSQPVTRSISLTGAINKQYIGMTIKAADPSLSGFNICTEGVNTFNVTYSKGSIDTWQWTFPSNWQYSGFKSSYTVTSAPTSGSVGLRATNECGTTTIKWFYITTNDCEGGIIQQIVIGPNPSNEGTVELIPESNTDTGIVSLLEKRRYDVKIFRGATMVRNKNNVKIYEDISMVGLSPDTYIFHITDDKNNIVTRQVVVN